MPELLKPDFETVFEVYYDRVYKYAYTILLNRENAEDVVEETFLAAYVAYPGYAPARLSSGRDWIQLDKSDVYKRLFKEKQMSDQKRSTGCGAEPGGTGQGCRRRDQH